MLPHTALAVTHNNHTAENHDSGKHLRPCEHLHTHSNAYHNGNDGLNITVHTYQRRPDTFLPHGSKELGYERSTEDEKGKLGKLNCRNCTPIQSHNFPC